MRACIQRVSRCTLSVAGELVSEIDKGLFVLVCAMKGDTDADLEYMAKKIPAQRLFSDPEGKMNLSVQDIGGEILLVPQFTLAGDARKGTRPSYSDSLEPLLAKQYYERLCEMMSEYVPVRRGVFGADMAIEPVLCGPVTLFMDSTRLF